ncbi:hypothetical protein [Acinetobacter rathckeae]|uniref:hypothetical protein n=1 Tax=Acinetobacter rathckeae TaxID=2605272 RepID=UPI0018A2827A|nr:hypothetical protein [Acinetobacter rathckeae]MBF7687045.1 hypothetical protein [Acinetobacter rathckeae]
MNAKFEPKKLYEVEVARLEKKALSMAIGLVKKAISIDGLRVEISKESCLVTIWDNNKLILNQRFFLNADNQADCLQIMHMEQQIEKAENILLYLNIGSKAA